MKHIKGGRGKRAPYRTLMVRVPEPIKQRVHDIVMEYHKEISGNDEGVDNNSFTGNNLNILLGEIIVKIKSEAPGFKVKSARQLIEAVLSLEEYL